MKLLKKCLACLLCLAIVLPVLSGCNVKNEKTPLDLTYTFFRAANRDTVDVNLTIKDAQKRDKLELYLSSGSKPRIKSIVSGEKEIAYEQNDGFIQISNPPSELTVVYTASVGSMAKHGKSGFAEENQAMASGEQLLLLPLNAISVAEKEVKADVGKITLKYEDDLGPKVSMPPTELKDISWNAVYQLKKSAFVFGDFKTESYKNDKGTLYLDYQPEHASSLAKIKKLYDYYCGLFGAAPKDLRICLLNPSETKDYIMAGSGAYTIGATFVPETDRDWELLSHRMFHAFYDSISASYISHVQPNLWLYEGLATYYETLGMKAIGRVANIEDSFSTLFAQYVYMSLKDSAHYSLAPMKEKEIAEASQASNEFLHYYQGPLVVYATSKQSDDPDLVLKNMMSAAKDFADGKDKAESIAVKVLKSSGVDDNFISKYVEGKELLPLWELKLKKDTDLFEVLNQAESDFYTWQRLENSQHGQGLRLDLASPDKLDQYEALAKKEKVSFAPQAVQDAVLAYEPDMYRALMKSALHAKVCGFNLGSMSLWEMLSQENNIITWLDYIDANIK